VGLAGAALVSRITVMISSVCAVLRHGAADGRAARWEAGEIWVPLGACFGKRGEEGQMGERGRDVIRRAKDAGGGRAKARGFGFASEASDGRFCRQFVDRVLIMARGVTTAGEFLGFWPCARLRFRGSGYVRPP
jgi:hypothetical protein